VFVHGVEAVKQLDVTFRTDGDHRRKADGRFHRVATAHPVPEHEHVVGVDSKAATFSAFVDTATKCFATADSSPSCSMSHVRADVALVSVSSVPKVFEEIMKSVSSASRPRSASTKSVESTLDTKWKVRSRRE